MVTRSESSYIVHDIIPLFKALGYPGAGDSERVKVNDVPVFRPSGGRSSSTMDIVYYHNGEPLLIVEAKRKHKSHNAALREAQEYRKNFPVKKKEYAPSGVGNDIQFYKDIFIVENNQLKQFAKPENIMKFAELLEFYGLVADFKPRILTGQNFTQEFLSELIRLYDVAGRKKVSPELIVKISCHIVNYLIDDKKYIHKKPFTDLDNYPLRQKGITDIHNRYDLLASLGSEIAYEYRRFLIRAFQGTQLNQYLTPQCVISFMLDICKPMEKNSKLIDFECGSGGYIAEAIEKGGLSINNVLGIDIDRRPIIFSKTFLALFLAITVKQISNIPLKKGNGLLYSNSGWDFVIGNPAGSSQYKGPGLSKVLMHLSIDLDGDGKDTRFSEYNFSIHQAIWLAKPGGIICLVIPEGLLSNSNDQFLRDFICRNCKILAIISLPRGTFRKGKTTQSSSSRGQLATMKMNILLMKKFKNPEDSFDDYPIFLAHIYDSKKTQEDIDYWLKPRLDLVYKQWLNWINTSKLDILDEELIKNIEMTEIKAVRKKTIFKDPDQFIFKY